MSSNLALFEPPRVTRYSPPEPADVCRQRHLGNDESEAANRRIHGSKEATRLRILAMVEEAGEHGMTAKEIAAALGRPLHAISGRCSELRKDLRLVPGGAVREGSRSLLIARKEVSEP